MDNKTSTILIIGYDGNSARSINIKTHFIKFYKRYLALLASIVLLSIIGLLYLFMHINDITSENINLAYKLFNINKEVDLIDSLKLKDKLNNIDNNLSQIQGYLRSRGVMEYPNAGGESSENHNKDLYKISFFDEQSEVFLNKVEKMPLGYPYNGEISSGYGYRYNPFGGRNSEFHPGVDFKGSVGDNVYATGDGVVERSDWYEGYGLAVVIRHESGLTALYGHLSRVNVIPGQRVKAGEVIGYLGSTGRSTGPHVHYEIRKDGVDIDPYPFLKIF
jgi:murein DD-endopeptidase MepM/ murein hydrolase activator NlpD